jgi:ElaB/YqjD/DUF883 family membrane-anchored ribosome-binding protein
MATESHQSKTNADYEAVVAQMTALREDMAKLMSSMSSATASKSQALVRDVADGVTEATQYLSRKGQDADVRLEAAVAANPYIALGIAAGMGVLLGALTRR